MRDMNGNSGSRHLLMFGATGGTGRELVQLALQRGDHVTAFVRDHASAARLFAAATGNLQLISGDALDATAVAAAFEPRPDAVICALGIYQGQAGGDDLTRVTRNIVAAMQQHDVRRLLCISSLGVGVSYLQGDFATRLIQRTSLRHTLADKEMQEALIRDSGLDWTVVRPSRLMNGRGPAYYRVWQGAEPDEKLSWTVNRADVAAFTLDCLDAPDSFGAAYMITGCKTPPRVRDTPAPARAMPQ